jgi:coenzyme PQQ precursor peptide PqqA
MAWETPSFEEVKMDAEINSYQDDLREMDSVEELAEATPLSIKPM